jgi:hypothetical protein
VRSSRRPRAGAKRPASERVRVGTIEPEKALGFAAAAPARALPAAVAASDGARQRFLMLVLGVGLGLLLVSAAPALPGMRVTYTGRLIAHYRLPIVGVGAVLVAAVCVVLAASGP